MIRKIDGKHHTNAIKHLSINNCKITSKKDIANQLAKTISKNSSAQNGSQQFLKLKEKAEKQKLRFKLNNTESYNLPCTIEELNESLKKAHNTTVGPDDIHYQFIKQLPNKLLELLLNLYNNIWTSSNFLDMWGQSFIIPIPKSGKDDTDSERYRLIALLSCLCKTMERMVNNRLTWYMETNGLIINYQCALRKKRSTIDHLVGLKTFVREAFIKKEHLTTVEQFLTQNRCTI